MSTLYDRFRASVGRDGPDYSIVLRARGAERDRLEDDLLANLDYYEIPALALMNSTKAIPHLRRRLPTSTGSVTAFIGRALWDLTGDPASVQIITSVLRPDDFDDSWSDRVNAANLLRGINRPEANAALREALYDEEYLVRFNAAASLAANHGRRLSDVKIAAALADGDRSKIDALASRLAKRPRSGHRKT